MPVLKVARLYMVSGRVFDLVRVTLISLETLLQSIEAGKAVHTGHLNGFVIYSNHIETVQIFDFEPRAMESQVGMVIDLGGKDIHGT